MARWFFLCVLLSCLTGCLPVYHTDYELIKPKSQAGQECVHKCFKSKLICQKYCQSDESSRCEADERARAKQKYQLYLSEMKARQKPAYRTEESFFDPAYCRFLNRETHGCNCEADHRICYKLCGGKVVERKTCVTNCG